MTIGPWTLRNYYVYNRFVPLAFHDGDPLVDGNIILPRDRKTAKAEALRVAWENLGDDDPRNAFRVDYNAAMKEKAMEVIIERQPTWILEKIGKFGPLLLMPYGWFLQRGLDDPAIFGEWGVKVLFWVFVGSQVVILLLASLGLGRCTPRAADVLLVLYVLFSFGVHIVTQMIQVRYQLPYLWIIILFACRVFVDRVPWNRRRLAVSAACLGFVMATLAANTVDGLTRTRNMGQRETTRRLKSAERSTLFQRKAATGRFSGERSPTDD